MRTEVINADSIDESAERILQEINVLGAGRRNKVIYFNGWDGLGASAVLREVSRRLTGINAGAGGDVPELLRVLHIDCSKWESRRTLQRALAVQLDLPTTVMELFDSHDEVDDYRGVTKGSRAEIPEICEEISRHVQRQDIVFVVIFHNGSDDEVDLDSLGFPLSSQFSRHKVLWSFQGRFRLYPKAKIDAALMKTTSTTGLFLSAEHFTPISTEQILFPSMRGMEDMFLNMAQWKAKPSTTHPYSDSSRAFYHHRMIIRREAEDLTRGIDSGSGVDSLATAAANCVLYMTKLCRTGNDLTEYDLATHGFNYCICDGVIQQGVADDRLWRWADALQREMRLDTDCYQNPHPSSLRFLHEHMAFWASPTCGFMLIPASQLRRIHQGMFLPFDGLCVLKLYGCAFSFKSPPFLCCHHLRFLWIEDCQCQEEKGEEVAGEDDLRRCFEGLWVLHVQNTHNDFLSAKTMSSINQVRELNVMGQDPLCLFQGQLPNVRKLRVVRSRVTMDGLPLGMDKLELLNFSGYLPGMKSLPVVSGCRSLVTVIIQGNGQALRDLVDISLKGCTNLKNLFLSGSFPNLHSLDISGTAVKTVDLIGVKAPWLDKLFLLDCWNLCAILWPSPLSQLGSWGNLGKGNLGIDTIQRDHHDAGRSTPWPTKFGWYIATRDARFLWSLEPLKNDLNHNNVHLDISTIMPSSSHPTPDARIIESISGQQEVQQLQCNNNNIATIYSDFAAALAFKDDNSMQQEANEGGSEPLDIMRKCPPPPCLPHQACYIHLEDQQLKSSQAASITVSGFICDSSKILHIHDSLFVISILASSSTPTLWRQLEWCRVERCPKLECVFSDPQPEHHGSMLDNLKTIWASRLPNARYIWKWSGPSYDWLGRGRLSASLRFLTFLHLDRCPRLTNAVSVALATFSMWRLETLEIAFCGDLCVVFSAQHTYEHCKWELPTLKHIHLHELPKLGSICGGVEWRVLTPKLETVKIRGCWSLKRLPYAGGKNTVRLDCEREWWDTLEWGSKDHAESYKPFHLRYYKKRTILRGSVLR